jgi:Mn2+/Fe2+ NRAMP family transporter
MNLITKLFYLFRKIWKAIRLFLIISGPGLVVMIADNDAGGITTYAATGAKYGYNMLWLMVVLIPVAYYVQEMTVRLGAVTKRGHAEAIFENFGAFWGWFSIMDLMIVDWLTLVTEFVGMTAAASLIGMPPWLTVIVACIMLSAIVIGGKYWTWEKLSMLFCVVNLIYIPSAFLVNPTATDVWNGFIPNLPGGKFDAAFFFFIMANIGTTIAPWMIFFQQSAVVDKGMTEKDVPFGKFDTLFGSIITCLVAGFIIVVTGTLLLGVDINDAAQAAEMMLKTHKYAGAFMAIGLFDAGFLGAICISLATSWAFGEIFGWAHSLNNKIKEAPWFYGTYILTLVTAGLVVLIPGAPLVLITLFVQVVAVTLLPAALVFLILLLNDKETMGDLKNSLWENIVACVIVGTVIVMSTLYAISTLFPDMFGQ